jgi:hypothetical protein
MRQLLSRKLIGTLCLVATGLIAALAVAQERADKQQPWSKYKVHEMTRPAPPVVTPGTPSTQDQPGKPPSDAIVLFDGKNFDNWAADRGNGPVPWTIENGYAVSAKTSIHSKQQFGDCQLHVEWFVPPTVTGASQERGNSGVFLMGRFEMQVLDNYNNPTYPDGQCGAIYGQYPPQVNVCLPQGQWQTYDFIFHRPRFKDGQLAAPGYVTTIQNGVVVQDHQRLEGPTGHNIVAKYPKSMPEKGPIGLQFHPPATNTLHFRNIWVRPLEALEVQQQTGEIASKIQAGP